MIHRAPGIEYDRARGAGPEKWTLFNISKTGPSATIQI